MSSPARTTDRRRPGVMKRLILAATLAGVAAAGAPATAQAAPQYPVPYGLIPGIVHFVDRASPPGANDWNCRPSAEHPEPVVLVHGLTATMAANWTTIAPLLANNGYCVFALNYGLDPAAPAPLNLIPGTKSMRESSAQELAPFVDRVLAATGAQKVDLVGHSEGTVMPRWYIKYLGGAAKVAKSVNLTPLNDGTRAGGQALIARALDLLGVWDDLQLRSEAFGFGASLQMTSGSDYLDAVNSGDAYPADIDYTFIMTRWDQVVAPHTSGMGPIAPNVTNIVVQDQCPLAIFEHAGAASDPVVAQHILNALDPANRVPVNCFAHPRNG
ncbi:alpha/beta fold hydrolase [Nocardia sp. XZ_19_231]|uniref:lipase family alpha/beta hydrolase n=1 Tax=Nocardia sp. XZ_19_231 TaxID=2769252 RepID=UPI001E33520B|nr:alpha/beta fold hydrolase [Nocardia sp. XZ_19_231]